MKLAKRIRRIRAELLSKAEVEKEHERLRARINRALLIRALRERK